MLLELGTATHCLELISRCHIPRMKLSTPENTGIALSGSEPEMTIYSIPAKLTATTNRQSIIRKYNLCSLVLLRSMESRWSEESLQEGRLAYVFMTTIGSRRAVFVFEEMRAMLECMANYRVYSSREQPLRVRCIHNLTGRSMEVINSVDAAVVQTSENCMYIFNTTEEGDRFAELYESGRCSACFRRGEFVL